MDLNNDGTITFVMPMEGDGTFDVVLRRPRLEEMFELWEEIDRISGATAPVAKPTKKAAAKEEDADVADAPISVNVLETMRTNARWTRTSVARLGPVGLYEPDPDKPGDYRLAKPEVYEPSWFVNGKIAGQWLNHWQEVP